MKLFLFVLEVILILGIVIPIKVIAQDEHNPSYGNFLFSLGLGPVKLKPLEETKAEKENIISR